MNTEYYISGGYQQYIVIWSVTDDAGAHDFIVSNDARSDTINKKQFFYNNQFQVISHLLRNIRHQSIFHIHNH